MIRGINTSRCHSFRHTEHLFFHRSSSNLIRTQRSTSFCCLPENEVCSRIDCWPGGRYSGLLKNYDSILDYSSILISGIPPPIHPKNQLTNAVDPPKDELERQRRQSIVDIEGRPDSIEIIRERNNNFNNNDDIEIIRERNNNFNNDDDDEDIEIIRERNNYNNDGRIIVEEEPHHHGHHHHHHHRRLRIETDGGESDCGCAPPAPEVARIGRIETSVVKGRPEIVLHRQPTLIVRRPPTTVRINHAPMIVKPSPVLFHRAGDVTHHKTVHKHLKRPVHVKPVIVKVVKPIEKKVFIERKHHVPECALRRGRPCDCEAREREVIIDRQQSFSDEDSRDYSRDDGSRELDVQFSK